LYGGDAAVPSLTRQKVREKLLDLG